MSVEVTGINKPAEIDRKENLREHQLYWIGRRTEKSYHNFAVLPDAANPTGGSGNLPIGFGQK